MDKETLSNYGWIVICVLVLAVMLALATPFGTFIADGFKATYTGLFQTGDNAMDTALGTVGVSNKLPCGHGRKEAGDHSQKECGHYNCQDTDCGCVPASCGVEGHWSGDGKDHSTTTSCNEHDFACQCSGWVVPEGGTYTMWTPVNGKVKYISGEQLPCGYESKTRDCYTFADYEYYYNCRYLGGISANDNQNGWGVFVIDETKTSYGAILESINSKPVNTLQGTFLGCANLIVAPAIPNTVINMSQTFESCSNLTSAPAIPSSVTNMTRTFWACTSLTETVSVPCTSTTSLTVPSTVTLQTYHYEGCGH